MIGVRKIPLSSVLGVDSGASLIGLKQAGAGAITRTVQDKMREAVSAKDFGAAGDGVVDDTDALFNFFTHCINTGIHGHIAAGEYLVRAGELAFDSGGSGRAWPFITTDGYEAVTFKRADETDAPLVSISNGTAGSAVGNYWNGGCLGGITFDQNGKAKVSSQHGLSLRGVHSVKFGWMRANSQGGSCVYLPEALYLGRNPDPYAVTFCKFDGIEANNCGGFALENRNWVGLSGCRIGALRAIGCASGGWYGAGSGNSCEVVSIGSCAGWAFDDGTAAAATGGPPSRINIGVAELDDVQNGLRLNRITQLDVENVRFVVRHNFSPLNPSEGYWPRAGISIAGGASPSCTDIKINAVWRIEGGGTKQDVGTFTNLHGVASSGVEINNRVLDNAGLGFVDADFYANQNPNGSHLITNAGRIALDDRIKVATLVRSGTTEAVPNTGFGTAASKLAFATKVYDKGGYYDPESHWFTVPYSGLYRLSGKICLAVPAGTRVRMAFATDTAGVVTMQLNKTDYQKNAGAQHYQLDGLVSLAAGQRAFLMADQNTGAPAAMSAPISAAADLAWSIEAL